MKTKVAVVQRPPVLLDLGATIAETVRAIDEAAAQGARLVVFPESYLPGYPTWIWRLRPGSDAAVGNTIHTKLRRNAVDVARGDLAPVCDAAARNRAVVVVGLTEIDSQFSGSTLFNTVVVIGPDGAILNRHRKLMPTNPERMVWGMGDARGLRVVETEIGRIGCLICWESYMPLARFALYAQAMDIFIAPTWDHGETWLASMRHIAKEGGCWVISTATALSGADVPADFPDRQQFFRDDEWINPGDAVVIDPTGRTAAGPLHRDKAILFATIDPEAARSARKSLDVAGHYGRPDIFKLEIDRRAVAPVSFRDETD